MWNGRFLPEVRKHRYHPHTHHPGHLPNHLEIRSIERIDEEPDGPVELTHLGGGTVMWLVTIGFKESNEDTWDYIYESDDPEEEPSEEDILQAIADDLLN